MTNRGAPQILIPIEKRPSKTGRRGQSSHILGLNRVSQFDSLRPVEHSL